MMHTYSTILLILILSLSKIKTQYHLYYTDFVNESDFYYHCLSYKFSDSIDEFERYDLIDMRKCKIQE